MIHLFDLNLLSQRDFVSALGPVFEDSPWVAEAAWKQRPFASLASLHQVMVRVVATAPRHRQLALIQSHPDLALPAAMGDVSRREQSGAGLDRLAAAEADPFQRLNRAYRARFGFPFIIAVRGRDPAGILSAMADRMERDADTEYQQALQEIAQIARFRLEARVAGDWGLTGEAHHDSP